MSDFPHVHPDYQEYLPLWTKWRDATKGEEQIKSKGEIYLPRLYRQEPFEYKQYLSMAEWYNASGKTVDAMVGAHHRHPIAAELGRLEALRERACHRQTLEEVAQKATREIWTTGRVGLLAEIDDDKEPQLYLYTAESIVNWRYEDDRLVFVILRETYEESSADSPYVYECKYQYRFLEINEEGVYTQRVMRETEERGKKVWAFIPDLEEYPRKAGDIALTEIPFALIDYEGIDGKIGGSPIADIVSLNLKHYRVTANKANYLHVSSCPILHVDGLSEDERPKTKWGLGTGVVLYTMGGGSSSYTEPSGAATGALKEDLAAKEDQMARLGGSFLRVQKREAETAEAMRLAQSGEASTLQQITNTLSKGFTDALRALGRWLGLDDVALSVSFPTVFFDEKLEQWEAEFYLKLFSANQIDLATLLEALQGGGILKKEWIQTMTTRGQAPQKVTGNGTQEETDSSTRSERGEPLPTAG
jgi:hypothetical protein